MDGVELLYLTPYLISLLLLAGIFMYAVRQRYIRGARPFAWMVGGQMLATLGLLFELITPDLETRILWDAFQWLVSAFLIVVPFLVFIVQFTEHRIYSPPLVWGVILTLLGAFAGTLLTDEAHHLFYQNPRLIADDPFPQLQYDFTFVHYLYFLLFVYGINLYGMILLARRSVQPRSVFRMQYLLVAVGFLIPLVFSFLSLIDIQIAPQRDLVPIGFAAGSLLVAWGLFHYGLFDIGPLARVQVFEDFTDPVVVLDPKNRIVEINKAALIFLDQQESDVIGQSFQRVFTRWPALIEAIANPFVQSKEVSAPGESETSFFDLHISHILGRSREVIGRILVIRDITKLKNLEVSYQALTEELEQRIQKRTEELYNTSERYRTIIENQTDFIVRWKPDGTRTYVNDAYCRYWNVSYEQALAMNFLFPASIENRPGIAERISRLNSGAADVETEITQVTRRDGSLAWQEWTDAAIRDEWGKLIEIQSIGRDITERRRAEEDLKY